MNPLISIILPTYNGEKWIARAIQSVIAQDYQNWELIVLNDGSTDATRKIVETFSQSDPRIVYIENEKNLGIQKTLNKGIGYARGQYIARIDDDDMWIDQGKLKAQVDFLEDNHEYVLVGTNATIINEDDTEIGVYRMPTTDKEIRARILIKNCFLHPTIMARTEAIKHVGGYSEDVSKRHIEDYDLWLRLGTIGKFANSAIASVSILIHESSVTYQNRIVQAKRVWSVIGQYKKTYPNFLLGRIILAIRIAGFIALKVLPLPKSALYKMQQLYKKL